MDGLLAFKKFNRNGQVLGEWGICTIDVQLRDDPYLTVCMMLGNGRQTQMLNSHMSHDDNVHMRNICAAYMQCISIFVSYTSLCPRLDLDIGFQRVSDVSQEDLKWAFELMKECVSSL